MITLSQLFKDRSTDPTQVAAAEVRLRSAYTEFLRGNASKDDVELVLVDLAMTSGYFHVLERGVSSEDALFDAGARSVFGRIMRMTNLTSAELAALTAAVAEETANQ